MKQTTKSEQITGYRNGRNGHRKRNKHQMTLEASQQITNVLEAIFAKTEGVKHGQ